MTALTFDEAAHRYAVGGKTVPSVTQLLDRLHSFAGIPVAILDAAKERGTYAHKLCEYHDEGDLDPSSLGDYSGYLDAWIAFCRDRRAVWSGIECQGYSERYGYAGTMDRRGTLDGIKYVIDIKTAAQSHPVWGLQTAAYRQLCVEADPTWITARRATVQLGSRGAYKFVPWDSPDDWPAFLALITLSNWTLKA